MGRMPLRVLLLIWLLAGWTGRAVAENRIDVPPTLTPWRDWALHGAGEKVCPPVGNVADARICVFPTSLALALDATGAGLSLTVRLFSEGAVPLPSGKGAFVSRMTADGRPVAVADRDGTPVVWLSAGEHVLEGRLDWTAAPESLSLPPQIGIVRLTRNGAVVPVALTPGGELRLGGEASAKPVERSEQVRVFRLVTDGVPVTVTTRFRLEVSGLARTIRLAGAVPAGTLPLRVTSPVVAALGSDGSLSLDAGPGRYTVDVVARYPGRVEAVGPAVCPYGREIWSFAAALAVRQTRPEGMAAIDPETADVPGDWRGYPAFLAETGARLTLGELGRGAPVGHDALTLARELWLDFSGRGMTSRDTITGENRTAWTLALLPPGELGRVGLSGRDQPVVLLGKEKRAGVELRRSRLRLVAEARYPEAGAALPASGYDREFDRVSATLNLPPGWRLLAAAGPDTVRGGMLSGWTLLDLFLVFLVAVATAALAGRWTGLALGLVLLLTWHEPGAPTLAWLYVLAGLGLLRVTGEGGRLAGSRLAGRWAGILCGLALLGLAIEAVPFGIGQLRLAVAPQIDEPHPSPAAGAPGAVNARLMAMAPAPLPASAKSAVKSSGTADGAAEERLEVDPDAVIQTGPGLPAWHFEAATLEWKGPVAPGQRLRLFLLPPLAVSGLGLVRVGLLGLVLWLLGRKVRGWRRGPGQAAVAGLAVLLALWPSPARADGYPSAELLEELQSRLTAAPACLPHCLGSSGLELSVGDGLLRLVSTVDTAARAALPLPVVSGNWRPATVLLDGVPATALIRRDGGLMVLAEPGRHVVSQEGPVPAAVTFTIELPLPPGHVRLTTPGYRTQRLVAREGRAEVLECTRTEEVAGAASSLIATTLPAFFEVHRTMDFGLSWAVTTEVVRRSPATDAAMAAVPLLPGEQPDAAGVTAKDGRAMVSFPPGTERVSWRSRLPAVSRLELVAPPAADALAETWSFTAAAFYDLTFQGIPPAERLGKNGVWRPRFVPWPGERLRVDVSRPPAAPGALCTLERARLTCRQGGQTRDVTLVMGFRAAKGGRQAVGLPKDAAVKSLTVAGRETLPTGGPDEVGFTLPPGATEVVVRFREKTPLGFFTRTPAVRLGLPAVNVESRLELPADRWILATHGETPLGPAVLFWGWLAAVVVVALALSHTRLTPLSRRQWLLYGLGLVQATPGRALLAVAWLLGLGWRRRLSGGQGRLLFNCGQILLVLLTLAGLAALYVTLQSGLLGLPRTQVGGGGSTATALVWTFDRVAGAVPVSWVMSTPLFVFRLLMLAWAVWLACALIAWLRWGFDSLTEGGAWRSFRVRLPLPGRTGTRPDAGASADKKP